MSNATRPGPVSGARAESTVVSVHGPAGVVDLTVPDGADVAEIIEAYGAQAGVAVGFLFFRGRPAEPGRSLRELGARDGAVLVVTTENVVPHRPRAGGPGKRAERSGRSGRSGDRAARGAPETVRGDRATLAGWLVAATVLGAIAALTALSRPVEERAVVVAVLAAAAVVACVPFGPAAAARVIAAPALAAAACFIVVWDPVPERLPTVLGAAALAAAVAAAIGRAVADPDAGAGEALRVWIVVGVGWFAVAAGAALLGWTPQVVWAVLLLAAVLAARVVPSYAIDVPDDYLLDLERLAVHAWSARDRPPGKRGRVVVPAGVVAEVAARGGRSIDAAGVAVLGVVACAAPMLLWTADLPIDRIGARCLVGFGGGALLLAARGHRHPVARTALRSAGVLCWVLLAGVALAQVDGDPLVLLTGACILGGFGLAALAVAVGRGWRSAWWSRRAEVAEVACGAFAVASLVVAVGLFRWLWELTG